MKCFVFALLVAQALLQASYAQCIPAFGSSLLGGCGCGCSSPAIIPSPVVASSPVVPAIVQAPSVAASLADTLSLLTVSSLLSDTLPYGSNVIVAPPCGCGGYGYGGCGCGLGGIYY